MKRAHEFLGEFARMLLMTSGIVIAIGCLTWLDLSVNSSRHSYSVSAPKYIEASGISQTVFTKEYPAVSLTERAIIVLTGVVNRVFASTFDADLVPGAGSTYKLGTSAANWLSINDVIYFSGSNVGIGASSPASKLQVTGGDVYISDASRGFILRASDSSCWRTIVNTGGTLVTSSITCP